jgi:hypothetical protein
MAMLICEWKKTNKALHLLLRILHTVTWRRLILARLRYYVRTSTRGRHCTLKYAYLYSKCRLFRYTIPFGIVTTDRDRFALLTRNSFASRVNNKDVSFDFLMDQKPLSLCLYITSYEVRRSLLLLIIRKTSSTLFLQYIIIDNPNARAR